MGKHINPICKQIFAILTELQTVYLSLKVFFTKSISSQAKSYDDWFVVNFVEIYNIHINEMKHISCHCKLWMFVE